VAGSAGDTTPRGNVVSPVILSADWVLPVSGPPIPDGAVVVDGGRIHAVGSRAELGEGRRFADAAIIPGFVNAHSHLEYAVYAGFGDGLGFGDWIGLHVERKARIDVEDMEHIARLGAFECLRSGITTVGDCSFSGAAATACADLGLRGTIYLEVFGEDGGVVAGRFQPMRERIADVLSERVRLGISPHAPYTCSLELYRACDELGLPVATHLAESEDENEFLRTGGGSWAAFADMLVKPLGTTGIRALTSAGLLDRDVLAAHCVTADEEEISMLAEHDVAVAHCPRSNALLGLGIAPVAELLAAGVRVGIGTDSPASTPSFDMFEELRTAVALGRLRHRGSNAMSAQQVLQLATLGSASALGLDDELGSLEPGKQADLAVVSLEGSPYVPWEDPAAAVVMGGSASRVLLTLVGGEVRYEAETHPWQELRQRGIEARAKLLGR
jgi:cytosine/adenosine deaminase-related metal-dependent hydrolase